MILILALAAQLGAAEPIASDTPGAIIRAAIEMERIQNAIGWRREGPARFTPDERGFSVVFSRGRSDLEATEFTVRHFAQDPQTRAYKHSSLLQVTSFGNEPGITAIKWLPDGRRFTFLGAMEHDTPQVFVFDTITRRLERLTNHRAPIIDYDVSSDGATIVFLARQVIDKKARDRQRMLGVVARDGEPGWHFDSDALLTPNVEIVIQRRGEAQGRVLAALPAYDSTIYAGFAHTIRMSPDERFAVFALYVPTTIRESWRLYESESIQQFINLRHKSPPTYGLVDLTTGDVRPVTDAPSVFGGAVLSWAPRVNRVAVAGYLPWDAADSTAVRVSRSAGALIEVEVPSGRAHLIKDGQWQVVRWSPSSDTMVIRDGNAGLRGDTLISYLTLVRGASKWLQVDSMGVPLPGIFPRHSLIDHFSGSATSLVGIAQSLDSPPELGAYDITTGETKVITGFNDALKRLPRGEIEQVTWTAADSVVWRAHLVKPANYSPGKRYPAVLMIMDMSYCDTYVLDGRFYRASYPIQALASQGVAVLMVYFPPEFFAHYVQPKERTIVLAGTDGAVRYLIDRGIADSTRVAITGFSHAGYVAEYATQQSDFRYAATVAIDNWNGSYLTYVLVSSLLTWTSHERFYGGSIYGPGREEWFKHAIGLNPARFRTPILLEKHNSHHSGEAGTRVFGWEVYAGLKRFGKPVELVRYTYGEHTMLKPLEQWSAATRQVDWLRFWLQDYEDSAPNKQAQYARWRRLRAQQEQSTTALLPPTLKQK